MGRRAWTATAAFAVVALLALPACAARGAPTSRSITVLAAASLTDAFTALADDFEASHDAVTVRLALAGSQQLATQVVQGAPADVFASADTTQMDGVVEAGAVAGEPMPFAGNRLSIAVEPGNPAGVAGLADLADPALTLVLAAEEVPAGRYARQVLDQARVPARPDSLETNVRAVLGKVTLGEADAGIVYASDVAAADGDVDAVAIPDEDNVTATYPIALLAGADEPDLAAAFIDLVRSEAGQAVLADHGFAPIP